MSGLHLRLPTSSQCVTFPTVHEKPVTITWSEGRMTRTANYYMTKCYWGETEKESDTALKKNDTAASEKIKEAGPNTSKQSPVDQTKQAPPTNNAPKLTPTSAKSLPAVEVKRVTFGREEHPKAVVAKGKIRVIGETVLYIAAEFVDSRSRDHPLAEYHIKDLVKFNEKEASPRWVTLELNGCFHYGQSLSVGKWKRWLVYHPAIVSGMSTPKMFQHRFTGTPLSATAVTGVQSLTGAAPKEYKIAAKATAEFVNASYDLVKGVAGDPLHQFLGANGVEAAKRIETSFASRINKLSADDLRLLALQITEHFHAQEEDAQAKLLDAQRATEAVIILEQMKKSQAKKGWFWNLFGGSKSPDEATRNLVEDARTFVVGSDSFGSTLEKSTGLKIPSGDKIAVSDPDVKTLEATEQSSAPDKSGQKKLTQINSDAGQSPSPDQRPNSQQARIQLPPISNSLSRNVESDVHGNGSLNSNLDSKYLSRDSLLGQNVMKQQQQKIQSQSGNGLQGSSGATEQVANEQYVHSPRDIENKKRVVTKLQGRP